MRPLHRASAALAGLLAIAHGAQQDSEPTKHVDTAEQLVSRLTDSPMNVYGGGNREIAWEGNPATARTVCSSFVTLLLRRTYSWSNADFKTWFGTSNPDAAAYHDAIAAKNGFKKIIHVTALRPGDLLAVKYNDGHVSRNGVEDTGHVMVVAKAPRESTGRSAAPAGLKGFDVVVYDSSASGHGDGDTRFRGGKKFTGGIGRGTLRVFADASGQIAGYAWSDLPKSEYFTSPTRDLVAGRIDLPRLPFKAGAGNPGQAEAGLGPTAR